MSYESKFPKDRPPKDFIDWWYPTSTQEPSGASVGGHPDAARMWARREPGYWKRRSSGITAERAWLTPQYREEFLAWVDANKPRRKPFVSIAVPLERQKEVVTGVLSALKGPRVKSDAG